MAESHLAIAIELLTEDRKKGDMLKLANGVELPLENDGKIHIVRALAGSVINEWEFTDAIQALQQAESLFVAWIDILRKMKKDTQHARKTAKLKVIT